MFGDLIDTKTLKEASIKEMINKEKKDDSDKDTMALGLVDKDFEELKDMHESIIKNNVLLKIFLGILIFAALLVTAYANLVKDVTEEELRKIYEDAYKDEQFVRFLNAGVCPETRWVEGSNYVDVNVKLDERTHRVIMMGAMDNLVKGAAGQAVQNMNLLFGLPETEGLLMPPVFP